MPKRICQWCFLLVLAVLCLLASGALAWQPNDPDYGSQWGLRAIGMESAWDYNLGGRPDVKVAVIDSGVDYNIADFAGTRFDLANAWDYVDHDSQPFDETGHGTHVAATIAQTTNNGTGSAGIAFNTTILPIRVLDEDGYGEVGDVAAGVYRAVNAGADIINLSMGSYYGTSTLYNACEYAEQKGVLVVAAAGNNWPYRAWPDYPARWSNTLVVGAVQSDLNIWYPSQYAWDNGGPGLVAPGVNINQQTSSLDLTAASGSMLSGTSMATRPCLRRSRSGLVRSHGSGHRYSRPIISIE